MSSDFSSLSILAAIREDLQISHSSNDQNENREGGGGFLKQRQEQFQEYEVIDYDAIIAELKGHSERIREAHKAVESSHSSLEKSVIDVRNEIKKKEQELKLLNSWPLQIADDAQKWIEIWEGRFGKRLINSQNTQLVENVNVVDLTAQTVNYCRRFIHYKRTSHEEWRESTKQMRLFYESEIKRVQQEVAVLKTDAARWELCATKNELCVVELNDRLKQLRLELLDRKIRFENTKGSTKKPRPTNAKLVCHQWASE